MSPVLILVIQVMHEETKKRAAADHSNGMDRKDRKEDVNFLYHQIAEKKKRPINSHYWYN